jgi:hypothetical protein
MRRDDYAALPDYVQAAIDADEEDFNSDGYYDRFFVLERRARLTDVDDAPATGAPADGETEGLPCEGASTTPTAQASSKITAAAGERASTLPAQTGRRVRDAARFARRKAARAAASKTGAPMDGETEGLPCEGASTTPTAQASSKITAAAGGRASTLLDQPETAHHDDEDGASGALETKSDDKTDAGREPASKTRGAVPQLARDAAFVPSTSSAPASAVLVTGTGSGVRADARSGQQVTFTGGPGDRRADLGRD